MPRRRKDDYRRPLVEQPLSFVVSVASLGGNRKHFADVRWALKAKKLQAEQDLKEIAYAEQQLQERINEALRRGARVRELKKRAMYAANFGE